MRRFSGILLMLVLGFSPAMANENPHPWWQGVLWYVPNRVMDLMDVFRLRAKVGPGLEVGARFTNAFAFYGGESKTFYVGLPGPRQQKVVPPMLGYEQKRGIVLAGLDATDDMPNPPHYEFSEIGVSGHLLFVGVDAGVSLTEFRDFLAGIVGVDLQGDDFPRSEKPPPLAGGGVLSPLADDPYFPIQPKPEEFSSIHERLDYLQANVPICLQRNLSSLDRSLTDPENIHHEQPPITGLRLELYFESISGPEGSISIDPKIKINIELPNLENQMSLFIQSSYDDDLPGTDIPQRSDKGWSVGADRQLDKLNISTEVGVHTKWPPELFARTSWRPQWNWDEWNFRFEYRLFWENEDGFGMYSSFQGYHWLGQQDKWLFRNLTAGKYSESTLGFEWQQTLNFGNVLRLKDEMRRRKNVGVNDILDGYSFNVSGFGKDEVMTKYKSNFIYRTCIYKDFVVLQFEPGLEWQNKHDWTTQYRMDMGLILLF